VPGDTTRTSVPAPPAGRSERHRDRGLIADDKACAPLANATIVVTDGRYLVTGLLPGTYKMTIYFCDGWTERDVAVVWMSR
jgi:hypothetical protein